MRIHTDILELSDLYHALPVGVNFLSLTSHKSRKRGHAFEVKLTGTSSYRTQSDSQEYAATWDEWGIFLGALFELDPNIVTPYYSSVGAFHYQTGHRFEDGHLTVENQHRKHNWEYTVIPRQHYCAGSKNVECDAIRRF